MIFCSTCEIQLKGGKQLSFLLAHEIVKAFVNDASGSGLNEQKTGAVAYSDQKQISQYLVEN